jgi:hypothetical protein
VVGAEWKSAFKFSREQRCVMVRQGGDRWSEQRKRTAFKFTREQRCVTVGQGQYRWSELCRGLHLNVPESKDVLWTDKEKIVGRSRAKDCI